MNSHAVSQRRGQLALKLQEAFTAAARLRGNRQVAADAGAFRAYIKELIRAADQEARQIGYDGHDVKSAVYAFIVFLDESVLNSGQAMFADWPSKPLQEEVFGAHRGGELFFQNLREILGRQDSEDVADLLEVYQLCLLLGFRGRYAVGDGGELRALMAAAAEKIQRVRGVLDDLSPDWGLPVNERIPSAKDPWLRKLAYAAGATFAVAAVLYVLLDFSLRGGVAAVQAIVP